MNKQEILNLLLIRKHLLEERNKDNYKIINKINRKIKLIKRGL